LLLNVIIAVKCDVCGTQITASEIPDIWHTILTWENSIFKDYDICSPKCYINQLQSEIKKTKVNDVDGMSLPFAQRFLEYINK